MSMTGRVNGAWNFSFCVFRCHANSLSSKPLPWDTKLSGKSLKINFHNLNLCFTEKGGWATLRKNYLQHIASERRKTQISLCLGKVLRERGVSWNLWAWNFSVPEKTTRQKRVARREEKWKILKTRSFVVIAWKKRRKVFLLTFHKHEQKSANLINCYNFQWAKNSKHGLFRQKIHKSRSEVDGKEFVLTHPTIVSWQPVKWMEFRLTGRACRLWVLNSTLGELILT